MTNDEISTRYASFEDVEGAGFGRLDYEGDPGVGDLAAVCDGITIEPILDGYGCSRYIQPVMTHRGIHFAQFATRNKTVDLSTFDDVDLDYASYVGFLENGYFAVGIDHSTGNVGSLYESRLLGGTLVGGESLSGTWAGAMIGIGRKNTNIHGRILQGDAEISLQFTPSESIFDAGGLGFFDIGADFTNIRDVNSGASYQDIVFACDESVDRCGNTAGAVAVTGGIVSEGGQLRASFLDANGNEMAGVIDLPEMVGSFGAKRQ